MDNGKEKQLAGIKFPRNKRHPCNTSSMDSDFGKIRLRAMPWQNQSWHTTLYITPKGFSTHPIPYQGQTFQIDFDFIRHQLVIQSSVANEQIIELRPKTVADFYHEVLDKLAQMGIELEIHGAPNEMEPAIPFSENTVNKII